MKKMNFFNMLCAANYKARVDNSVAGQMMERKHK